MSDARSENLERWASVAGGWATAREAFQRRVGPVSEWILDAARLAPGRRVLELACGPGETGLMAAERVKPGGDVLMTDAVEEMLDAARARARELGADNVSFKVVDAEWIDEPAASFDAVICRWGLMFPADPEAAFRETRRVLRPDGRVALAAWAAPDRNPWMRVIGEELLEQGLVDAPPDPDAPGPFRFLPPGRLRDLLEGAGFMEVEVRELPLTFEYAGFDDYWFLHSQTSEGLRRAFAITNERGIEALREGLRARLAPYTEPDGTIRAPAAPLVASATA